MIRSVYKYLRGRLRPNRQALLSKAVFSLGLKPAVMSNPPAGYFISGSGRGGLVMSLDFEMAWAFRYSKREVDPLAMARLEREQVPVILRLFDDYGIPATWATVGHLLLESCKKGDHDWMRRIPHFDDHWKYVSGDWFDHDPCTDFRKDSAWYAPDLVESILAAQAKHEIGCHTFSHIDCSEKNCPPAVLEDEIQACITAARNWGIDLTSFVFPGGTTGNYNVLKRHGFKTYRQKLHFDLAPPLIDDHQMVVSASTSSFGRNADWSAEYYVYRYKTMIDKAIKTNTIAHLWLHPSVDPWTLKYVLPEVLRYVSGKRDKGALWIGTMGQLADLVRAG